MANIGTSERPDLPLAVVVGAGGLGMATARRLGQHYRLLLADKNAEHVEKSAATLRDEGHDCIAAVCDVIDPVAVKALADKAKAHGPMRVLAHIVGLSPQMSDWKTIMKVDLIGPQLVADAMLPLAVQGTAAIFISSTGGYMVEPDTTMQALLDNPLQADLLDKMQKAFGKEPTTVVSYCMAKRGVMRMCERLAPAWGKKGARIMSMAPGMVLTPMAKLERQHRTSSAELISRIPVGRDGTMLELADGIEFLASDKASFISGIDLIIDGGMTGALRHGPKVAIEE